MFSACARIVVRHSYLIIFIVTLISTILTVIPLVCHEIPSFTDPMVGFETRGTTLAGRFIAWENLIDETRPSRSLAVNPQEIEDQARMNRTYQHNAVDKSRSGGGNAKSMEQRRRKKLNGTKTGLQGIYELMPDRKNHKISDGDAHPLDSIYKTPPDQPDNSHITNEGRMDYGIGANKSVEDEESYFIQEHIHRQWKALREMKGRSNRPSHHNYASGSCGSPVADFAHLVVTTNDNTSLLTFENLERLCNMQTWLLNITSQYYDMCQRQTKKRLEVELCCPMWSVPNYIALISGKDTCVNLTREEVKRAIRILNKCAVYFHNFSLMASCEMKRCRVPNFCAQYDAIYNLLFYLLDVNALSPPDFSNEFVKYVMIFLPLPASSTVLPYYNKLLLSNLTYDNLIIPAMDFGLKNTLFDLWVVQDTWLMALGGLFVFLSVWIYTKSLILTVLLFTAITYSLGIAYFMYVYVYKLEFFPFMNFLVIVIVIGIGADDAFLFVKVWDMVSKKLLKVSVPNQDSNQPEIRDISNAEETLLIQIMEETLKHSIVAIFITSLTTAVAFFASYVSYIPAINCFSVFAGTAVLVNFFLMISMLPASVYLVDVKLCKSKRNILGLLNKAVYDVLEDVKVAFNAFIGTCVTKLYILWIILLGGVGVGSIVVVFHYPGLQLPDSRQFQLFQKSHPFEQYDMHYRDEFMFERFGKDFGAGSKMSLKWVWGVKPIDNGNHMDPGSNGHVVFDNNFTISEPSSQVWLLNFCTRIKAQPFYQPTLGPLLPNCFIESFKVFMSRRCIDFVDRINRSPCCEVSTFPYKKEVFETCIIKAMESLYMTPRELFMPGVAGPKFLRAATPPTVAALVVEFESVVPYSMSYSAMDKFFVEVENWTQHELSAAPPGMQSGWFLSDLQFYDLQKTLASGTVITLLLSAGLGFVVLLPATMSFVISICALSAMIFSSTVTIAILVLNNWKLNVLESVAISTSAGLAVDFSLHYALSYKNAKGAKLARVKYALSASIGPTAAAALTTGFAGIFLLGSKLLPYSQIGIFLALIMSVSWVYATFFLCSLLRLFGSSAVEVPVEERKPVSRVSSICSGVPPPSETHELEHLADTNRTNTTFSHSPSSVSATTVVLHDDFDHAPCPMHNHSRLETIPSLTYYVDKHYDYD